MSTNFHDFMQYAIEAAIQAGKAGEVPVGAVIVKNQEIITIGENRTRRDCDPSAHAEIIAIRKAAKLTENFRLDDCDLYVTLEPCAMCAGLIAEARIKRLYFAAEDPKSGGTLHGARVFEQPQCHHRPEIYPGISQKQAETLLRKFFLSRRK